MIAVIYVRDSTDEQAQRGLSIPAQIEHCQKYAKDHGLTVARVFQDEGESATSANRPEFLEMIAYCKATRDMGAVIVYDTSRFARNREDAVVFKRMLEKRGVKVHYASQIISDDPEGKFLEGMLEVMDEHYSRALARVVKRGMIESAKRGNWIGMPPFGYRVVKTEDGKGRRLQVQSKEAEAVRLAFELFENGYGCKTISEKLNEKGYVSRGGKPIRTNAVKIMLTNSAYLGQVVFNRRHAGRSVKRAFKPKEEWIVIPGKHEPLIDKERFDRVQAELERRGLDRRPGELKTYRRFAGMVQCKHCGSTAMAMTGTSRWGKLYYYYACRTRCTKSTALCKGMRVRSDILEEVVVNAIQQDVFSDGNIDVFVNYVKARAKELDNGRSHEKISVQRKLEALQGKLRKVVLLAEDDTIDPDEAKRRTKELHGERQQLMEQYARLEDALAFKHTIPTKGMLQATREKLRQLIAEAEPRVQRDWFRRWIVSIKTDGDTADMTYNLGYLASGEGVRNSIHVSGP
jgi:site-specific DNA recombinase